MVTRSAGAVVLIAAATPSCHSRDSGQSATPELSKTTPRNVGCVGKIVPANGTFFIAAPASAGRVPLITALRIHAGDNVVPGQIVATLDSRAELTEAVREAEARLGLERARLASVKAGASAADADVARAELARLRMQRESAWKDVERNRPLLERDFISRAQMEALENRVRDADALIHQTEVRIDGLSHTVRPEDVAIAERAVQVAETEAEDCRRRLDDSVVRAQAKGRLLRVLAHVGEPAGPPGIAEVADTSSMIVMAEVYEADIGRVRTGQKAVIRSDLLPHALSGQVIWISPEIDRQELLSAAPGAPLDARIFHVKISVPDQSVLAERINGAVDVVIETETGKR